MKFTILFDILYDILYYINILFEDGNNIARNVEHKNIVQKKDITNTPKKKQKEDERVDYNTILVIEEKREVKQQEMKCEDSSSRIEKETKKINIISDVVIRLPKTDNSATKVGHYSALNEKTLEKKEENGEENKEHIILKNISSLSSKPKEVNESKQSQKNEHKKTEQGKGNEPKKVFH